MTANLRLTQMLAEVVGTGVSHEVSGSTVTDVLEDLFGRHPGLRGHILDETGTVRPHVAVFVNGSQARLDGTVPENAEVYVLHAVSGG